ncbi:MAG: hypothetical protein HY323_15575 [Betaproteobacteria bacterium]|nr:hypothetical protein [Betaproteobacteria bacterium]
MTAAKDLSHWRVETLRLTAFPTSTTLDISGIKWWEGVTSEQPESRNIQPRIGTLQEVGPIRGGLCNLSFEYRPPRLDWLFSPILKDKQELTDFPTFATFPDGLNLFEEILVPWLGQCPSANRIAFGVVLIQPVENRKAGYQLLGKYLPSVKLDADTSSDFSYQINRPRPSASGIANLRINRLSRWSVVRLSGMLVQLSVGAGQPTAQVFESKKGLDACRVELDINTSPEFEGALSQEKLASVVNELVALGVEIATKGDIL